MNTYKAEYENDEIELKTYKAEYEDDEIEVFGHCSNDEEALDEAWSYEKEHGVLWGLWEINEDCDIIRNVF